jgi:hypothetical protein
VLDQLKIVSFKHSRSLTSTIITICGTRSYLSSMLSGVCARLSLSLSFSLIHSTIYDVPFYILHLFMYMSCVVYVCRIYLALCRAGERREKKVFCIILCMEVSGQSISNVSSVLIFLLTQLLSLFRPISFRAFVIGYFLCGINF